MNAIAQETIEVESSGPLTLGLAGLGVLMTAVSAAVTFNLLDDPDMLIVPQAIGAIGMVFFAFCTLVWLWRFLNAESTVLTLSSRGIRDRRVAAETIPWTAVRNVSTWECNGQRILVLGVDPAVERTLHLTMIARWSRGVNRLLGADGLCIATQGLTIGHDALLALVRRYVPQAQA